MQRYSWGFPTGMVVNFDVELGNRTVVAIIQPEAKNIIMEFDNYADALYSVCTGLLRADEQARAEIGKPEDQVEH